MKQSTAVTRARAIFLLATMILVVCGCGGTKTARLDVQTWDCGTDGGNITATLKSDGTLIVRGAGAMMDFDGSQVLTPWRNVKDSITSVIIKEGVAAIGRGAFSGCTRLTAVTIPNSVTFIGDFAFAGSAPVTIPNGVMSIGANALSRTASITVAMGNPNYSSIDGVLFNKAKTVLIQYPQGRKGTSYVIPGSVTSIGNEAFANCGNLVNVTIGSNVTEIGEFAFAFCPRIASVAIPSGVTKIGEGAFAHSGLTAVTSLNRNPPETAGKGPFSNVKNGVCLYVPENSIPAYRSSNHWKDFECVKAAD